MKKTKMILGIVTAVALMTSTVFGAGVKKDVKVEVNKDSVVLNGEPIETDVLSYNNTTYLPLRIISENMGMTVDYNDKTGQINLKTSTGTGNGKNPGKGNGKHSKNKAETKNLTVLMGSVEVFVNGEKVEGQNIVYNGTTYLPLRKIAEATGATVAYDGATKTIYLTTDGKTTETTTSSAVVVVPETETQTETQTETKTEINTETNPEANTGKITETNNNGKNKDTGKSKDKNKK